ncbi:MAG: hypothetical protein ACM3NH_02865 [Candidatus Saccharibacteria bacterium]
MEETKVKCACGMPLTVESECECNPELCLYCCACPEGCVCNCRAKTQQ